ncbi:hypothetical protein IQ276_008245 [Desmonostoc muscorum LEGE 12446]|uniref:hypothetical protein n=1 Tax=Desmonostoc muscorum TaxID=1179 RepID=UPI001F2624C4|nr:hypothetical protein [Desmonostoc muscorum]MCF2146439.1 hypothetical protein [Desmonostoc muscorum LEGE 12446]
MSVYKGLLPQLKVEYPWLKQDCYSSVLQCVAINLDKAYKNFFEGRARFPKFNRTYATGTMRSLTNSTKVL